MVARLLRLGGLEPGLPFTLGNGLFVERAGIERDHGLILPDHIADDSDSGFGIVTIEHLAFAVAHKLIC